MAFYDLSALSDHVADCDDFFRKLMDTVREIVDPNDDPLDGAVQVIGGAAAPAKPLSVASWAET
ncbi:MAG: hypothetical protein IH956_02475 [Chloroflexi bacterium]|nr:hypothetical protein [Chloroflexota bacterium]